MSHVDEETFLPGTTVIAAQDVVKEVAALPLPVFQPLVFSLEPWVKTLYERSVI